MSSKKEVLRDAVLNYLFAHGISNFSLRPLATAIGTSPRMLMFYFKSKDGLIREVLAELHRRLQQSFSRIAHDQPNPRRERPLKLFWRWATNDENIASLRLLYEIQIVSASNPVAFGRYFAEFSETWEKMVRKAMQGARSRELITLTIAVFDGLMLEMIMTGDLRRLDKALNLFISLASQPSTRCARAVTN